MSVHRCAPGNVNMYETQWKCPQIKNVSPRHRISKESFQRPVLAYWLQKQLCNMQCSHTKELKWMAKFVADFMLCPLHWTVHEACLLLYKQQRPMLWNSTRVATPWPCCCTCQNLSDFSGSQTELFTLGKCDSYLCQPRLVCGTATARIPSLTT